MGFKPQSKKGKCPRERTSERQVNVKIELDGDRREEKRARGGCIIRRSPVPRVGHSKSRESSCGGPWNGVKVFQFLRVIAFL